VGDCEVASFHNVLLRQKNMTMGLWHRFCFLYGHMVPTPAQRQGSAMAGVINHNGQAKDWSTGHMGTLSGVPEDEGRGYVVYDY
jgi:hypothetical protein